MIHFSNSRFCRFPIDTFSGYFPSLLPMLPYPSLAHLPIFGLIEEVQLVVFNISYLLGSRVPV